MIFSQRALSSLLASLCCLLLIGTQAAFAQGFQGINSVDGAPLNFSSSGSNTPYMTISTSGNIGIWEVNPGQNVPMTGGLTINGTGGTMLTVEQNNSLGFALNVQSAGTWQMYDHAGGVWNFSLSSSGGKIGIGAVAPADAFQVEESFLFRAVPWTTGDQLQIFDPVNSSNYLMLGNLPNGSIIAAGILNAGDKGVSGSLINGGGHAGGTLLLNPIAGNIGIGTFAPSGTLDVENATNNATLCLNGSCTSFTPTLCHMVRNEGPPPTYVSDARCNPGEFAINGGGIVVIPADTNAIDLANCPLGGTLGFLHTNSPDGDGMGWTVDGYNVNGTGEVCTVAYAMCCPR